MRNIFYHGTLKTYAEDIVESGLQPAMEGERFYEEEIHRPGYAYVTNDEEKAWCWAGMAYKEVEKEIGSVRTIPVVVEIDEKCVRKKRKIEIDEIATENNFKIKNGVPKECIIDISEKYSSDLLEEFDVQDIMWLVGEEGKFEDLTDMQLFNYGGRKRAKKLVEKGNSWNRNYGKYKDTWIVRCGLDD